MVVEVKVSFRSAYSAGCHYSVSLGVDLLCPQSNGTYRIIKNKRLGYVQPLN